MALPRTLFSNLYRKCLPLATYSHDTIVLQRYWNFLFTGRVCGEDQVKPFLLLGPKPARNQALHRDGALLLPLLLLMMVMIWSLRKVDQLLWGLYGCADLQVVVKDIPNPKAYHLHVTQIYPQLRPPIHTVASRFANRF